MKTFIIKNWKTATFLKAKGLIDTETVTYILAVLGALGFVAAKDADKTGL